MADFAAVIRKTLGNMSETTPELRAKVYDKARATVRRQIDAMEKTPPQAAVDRQFAKLEDAISSVEADYISAGEPEKVPEPEAAAPVVPQPEEPAPSEPDVPDEPTPTEPEVPAEPEPTVPEVPDEPEPEVPVEPEPTPAEPEPEVPEPAEPEPEITPPYDPSPEVPESHPDAPLPSRLEVNEAEHETPLEQVPSASDLVNEQAIESAPVDDTSSETPIDAVEAVDDVSDGIIVDDGAISAEKAIDDVSSAPVETPISDIVENLDADENSVVDDAGPSVDEINKTIGELFAGTESEPESEKSMPVADSDPLADFLKEQEANYSNVAQDFAVSADSQADDVLDEVASSVETVSASVDDDFGAVEGERRDSSTGIPPLVSSDTEEKSRGGTKKATIAVVVLALLAGGAYAAYEKKDQLSAFYNESALPWWKDLTGGGSATDIGDAATSGEEGGVPVRTVTSTSVENGEQASAEEIAAAEGEVTPPLVEDVSDAEETPTKFTQRLTEDGTEIDEGSIEGVSANEGSSVSPQTEGTDNSDTQGAEETNVTEAPDAAAETPATPVGQRAIFYEERTGSQDGTALAGATVWTVVNESPGGELAVEPAIRAETSIPELGLKMEMTIRRNGDSTFPASHIIELFFRVPENFAGRGIADVQRVTFKTNEQDPGNALIAVPAPLDQNIFLIALTDATTAVDTNVQLMTRENWIDIPMQYTNGRRALITLEKGIPGERVFKEVFAAWDAAPIEN